MNRKKQWMSVRFLLLIPTILWFVKNNMAIQMTKRYFSDIFDLCPHPQFLAHSFEISLGPRPLGASFVIIFGLLSSVPEITSEPERWNGVLLSITSSFLQQLVYVNDVTFGTLLRKGASRVGNQLWLVADSGIGPTPWFLARGEGMEVEFVSNGQELPGCWTRTHHCGWCIPNSMVTDALKFESLPDLVLYISWSGCSFISLNILCNTLVI